MRWLLLMALLAASCGFDGGDDSVGGFEPQWKSTHTPEAVVQTQAADGGARD